MHSGDVALVILHQKKFCSFNTHHLGRASLLEAAGGCISMRCITASRLFEIIPQLTLNVDSRHGACATGYTADCNAGNLVSESAILFNAKNFSGDHLGLTDYATEICSDHSREVCDSPTRHSPLMTGRSRRSEPDAFFLNATRNYCNDF